MDRNLVSKNLNWDALKNRQKNVQDMTGHMWSKGFFEKSEFETQMIEIWSYLHCKLCVCVCIRLFTDFLELLGHTTC